MGANPMATNRPPPPPPTMPRRTRKILCASGIPTDRVRLWEKILNRTTEDAILEEMLQKIEVYYLLGDQDE